MKALLDTSVLVDHLRGDDRATTLVTRLFRAGEVIGSVMTRAEVLAGMRAAEKRATNRLLNTLTWIPVDVHIADQAGALARRYRTSHPGVDTVDYVIAATVAITDAVFYTRNIKHFPMIKGLRDAYTTQRT